MSSTWKKQARFEQLPPKGGVWRTWLILAGRGFGKTRTGAETIHQWAMSKKCQRIALVGATENDVRSVMIDGESGIMNIASNHQRPAYETTRRRLVWPNGIEAYCYSGDYYDQLRGPQFDVAWVDELAKFKAPERLWEQLNMCMRLGEHPRIIITTTPRPIDIFTYLLKDRHVRTTRGSTFDNADNLSPSFIEYIHKSYDGTRIGAQELHGEILQNTEGALWQFTDLEAITISTNDVPDLQRVVIGVDPALTHNAKSDETGIITAGHDKKGHIYVLEDLSGKYSASEWAARAIAAYDKWNASCIVAESNAGGDLVERILRIQSPKISYKGVRATRSKFVRAEPVAALYQQKRVSHVKGLQDLEYQMCTHTPKGTKSPDRLDALVWALTELAFDKCYGLQPKISLL
jgi:phage terminase large subunit-like protein